MSTDSPPQDPRRAEPPWWEGFLYSVGEPVVFIGRTIQGIVRTGAEASYYIIRGRIDWREVARQCYEIGNRSLIFIAFTLGFLGMILVFQAGYQAKRITGDLQLLGALFLQVLLREFAPTITALMIATRVGTGIAAEIGSMVVTEQVDAMRMNAAPPIQYLIVPRFIAGTVMMVVLVLFAVLVCYIAGLFTGIYAFNMNPLTFIDFSFITWADLFICLAKALVYGLALPIVAGYTGLNTHGGSAGVGWATTQSVVNCSLTVVLLDFVMSGLSYVLLTALS